ncbi:HAMP domain-containing protein [Vibrio sp. CAIM 722]|uniref:Sensor protein n=1 Tax=Vibrio eleionomae TaxID=2653505 RepID=A0A7X4LLE3_9VIBR|nr:type IV pili methyl-accepting chemotaxis transducer N-terminal domain-containing protein [Vibrio eleionomae]MZI94113.1 HAMP domain-containing protein [Vibrio eleionomae]
MPKLSRSIVMKITAIMVSLILMAFVSIFSSMYMSQISEYDGKTINLSGSLRMMSYRITTQVTLLQSEDSLENRHKVQQLIQQFETLFNDPVLKKDFIRFHQVAIKDEYDQVAHTWNQEIKPTLANANVHFQLGPFLPKLESFVQSIDRLVYGYQKVLEERLQELKIIQTITLTITLGLILLSIYSIHKYIARPLRELTDVAEISSQGDWSQRCLVHRDDELGLLAKTINKANQSMQSIHQDLEQRIAEKTQALSQSNQMLTFLYNVAQQVNQSHYGQLDFEAILQQLSAVSQLNNLELTLFTSQPELPYHQVLIGSELGNSASNQTVHFPIERNDNHYGDIRVFTQSPMANWQRDLVESLVDQLGIALSFSNQLNQERRIALLSERNIIARELHDSLAQSLSYLKFQVACIEKGIEKEPVSERVTTPVYELKEGVVSAYRQLRELLTTFRLQIDSGGLQAALSDTVQTLAKHSAMQIQLHYDCRHVPFEPNEEIHLLQITKEAVQNAVKHSQGSHITISLTENEEKNVVLLVQDDGIGFTQTERVLNHYGTEIMQERCHSLKGTLVINTLPDGGTEVSLVFTPNYLNNNKELG